MKTEAGASFNFSSLIYCCHEKGFVFLAGWILQNYNTAHVPQLVNSQRMIYGPPWHIVLYTFVCFSVIHSVHSEVLLVRAQVGGSFLLALTRSHVVVTVMTGLWCPITCWISIWRASTGLAYSRVAERHQ